MSGTWGWLRRRRGSKAAPIVLGRVRSGRRRRLGPEVLVLEDRRLMATVIPVTSTLDTGDHTLRDAIEQASVTAGPVVIDFRIPTPATITLSQGPLELSDTDGPVSIVGPGAAALTIDGDGAADVFRIDPGVTATVSGLTISGGWSSGYAPTESDAAGRIVHVLVAETAPRVACDRAAEDREGCRPSLGAGAHI